MRRCCSLLAKAWLTRIHYGPRAAVGRFDNLPRDLSCAYIRLLWYCASGGGLTRPEADYLRGIAEVWFPLAHEVSEQIADRVEPPEPSMADLALLMMAPQELRQRVLYDSVLACYMNNNYTTVEQQRVQRVATALGLKEGTVSALEDIAKKSWELQQHKVDILKTTVPTGRGVLCER